jgi:hypothetical protein
MAKRKSPIPSFMKYAGSISGPPDLSSRHGFERARERQIDSVYLLYHLRKDDPKSDTQLLLIGAYRSEDDAKAAIERLKSKPGFARHPDGFEYHAYALGVENWSEGF